MEHKPVGPVWWNQKNITKPAYTFETVCILLNLHPTHWFFKFLGWLQLAVKNIFPLDFWELVPLGDPAHTSNGFQLKPLQGIIFAIWQHPTTSWGWISRSMTRHKEYICLHYHRDIRRPESACSSNNLIQNPNRLQNPKSKIQDPKTKRPRLGLPQKEWILRQSKIQNPRSKIQDPKPKLQNPNSKIQTAVLDFGFWSLDLGRPGWGRRRWLCSKCSCMGGLATRIWRSWWGPKLVSKRSEARSPPRAVQIGHRFPEEDFAGNRAPISSPVLWKQGANFQKNVGRLWRAKPAILAAQLFERGHEKEGKISKTHPRPRRGMISLPKICACVCLLHQQLHQQIH